MRKVFLLSFGLLTLGVVVARLLGGDAATVPYVPVPGDPPALIEGIRARNAGDLETAKRLLVPLAESGHPKGMNSLGVLYKHGLGSQADKQTACDWYEKAAIAGYASAQSNLSLCFENGSGRPRNMRLALEWEEKAALQGDKYAQLNLAARHAKTDREKYRYWAAQGAMEARFFLWYEGDGHLVPDLSAMQIACVFVMIGYLGQPHGFCD